MAKVKEATLEESIQALHRTLHDVAQKADVERKVLVRTRSVLGIEAAKTIGSLMCLLWKQYRLLRFVVDQNTELREESMQMKQVNREAAGMKFEPVSKAHLN